MPARKRTGVPQPGDERYGAGLKKLLALVATERRQREDKPQKLGPRRSLKEIVKLSRD